MKTIQKKRSLELWLDCIWVSQRVPEERLVLYTKDRAKEIVRIILGAIDNKGDYCVELNHGVLTGRHEGRVDKVIFATKGQYFEESFSFEEYVQWRRPERVKVDLNLVCSREE